MEQLTERTTFLEGVSLTGGASGTTAVNAAECDMAGFDGVVALIKLGPITAGAVTSVKMQQDSTTGMPAAADIAGSGITVADTDDDKMIAIDVLRPTKRFLRAVVSRGTAAATFTVLYLRYNARTRPGTNGATVGTIRRLNAPAEGTP